MSETIRNMFWRGIITFVICYENAFIRFELRFLQQQVKYLGV